LHFLFLFLFILFFDVENILNRILCFLKMQNHYVNAYSTTADKSMQRKVWHSCGDKKILSMHVSLFVDIFFCSFFKLIITEHKSHNFLPIFFRASPSSSISEDVQFTVKKKITLLDEEYGCIVYSMLENNNQTVFFNFILLWA